jgi:hypothetical protein
MKPSNRRPALLASVSLLFFTFSARAATPNALDIKLNAHPRMHEENHE